VLASRTLAGAPSALFVSYSSALGGAERILLDVASGIEGAAVACPPGPLEERVRAAGLPSTRLRRRPLELRSSARDRLAGPARLAGLGAEVRRLVHAQRPRVLVAWNMRALLACRAGLAGIRRRPPLVFQHNDLLPGPLVGRAVRAAARRARATVCLSETIARDLDPGGSPGRVEVIPAGVDLARFRPTAEGPAAVGREVLVLGAIVEWKRPELALEVAARTLPELPDLRLRLAGEPIGDGGGELLERLRRRAEEPDLAGRVELAGQLPDPLGALRRAACMLHCADREPYGLALVEALACGLPVVAPAAGGPGEIVTERCGRLFEPGDADAAARGLADVLEATQHAEYRAAARARAERLYDREDTRRRYRALLDEVAG
jgi:glycosyltransferase involved in cell wall biosynthesis